MASRILFLDRVPPPASLTHPHITLACKADAAVVSNPGTPQAGSMQLHTAFADEADAAQPSALPSCYALTSMVFPNQVPQQVSSAHPHTASARKADTAHPRRCHAPTATAVVSNPVPLQAGSTQIHTVFADEADAAQRRPCHALTATVFSNQVPQQVSSMHPPTACVRKADTAQPRACHALNMTSLRFARQKPPLPSARGSVADSEPRPERVGAQLLMTLCLTVTMVFRNQSSNAVRLIEAVLGEV